MAQAKGTGTKGGSGEANDTNFCRVPARTCPFQHMVFVYRLQHEYSGPTLFTHQACPWPAYLCLHICCTITIIPLVPLLSTGVSTGASDLSCLVRLRLTWFFARVTILLLRISRLFCLASTTYYLPTLSPDYENERKHFCRSDYCCNSVQHLQQCRLLTAQWTPLRPPTMASGAT